jgi:hypothetical protein
MHAKGLSPYKISAEGARKVINGRGTAQQATAD